MIWPHFIQKFSSKNTKLAKSRGRVQAVLYPDIKKRWFEEDDISILNCSTLAGKVTTLCVYPYCVCVCIYIYIRNRCLKALKSRYSSCLNLVSIIFSKRRTTTKWKNVRIQEAMYNIMGVTDPNLVPPPFTIWSSSPSYK